MGKVTLEEKLAQQLSGIAHELLFQMFLDMWKAHNSLDRGRCREILRGYVMGYNTSRPISHHGESLLFVPKVGRLLGMAFDTGR